MSTKTDIRTGVQVRSLISDNCNVTVGLVGTVTQYSKSMTARTIIVAWENGTISAVRAIDLDVIT